jgi:hypothetical protein
MRFKRSLCGAAFLAGAGVFAFFTGFFAAGFLAGFLTLFADFAPAALLAAGFLAGFLADFRAGVLCSQGIRFSMASVVSPRARSAVELSELRGPSSTTRDGAGPSRRETPMRRASPA